jgi:ABC-type uncharacterized transport system permease subunit
MARRDRLPDGVEQILDRLVDASASERIAISFAAVFASMLVGALILLVSGVVAECSSPLLGLFCYNPLEVYYYLLLAPVLNFNNLSQMLQETSILIFTGLAVAISFRAGLFNIGTQGQFVLGSLAAALTAIAAGGVLGGGLVSGLLIALLALTAGAIVGGIYAAIPGVLKAYAGANEVITTIMLNFVAADVAFFLVSAYFQMEGSGTIETAFVPESAQFGPVVAMLLGLLFVAATTFVLWGTAFGFDLRTSGLQPDAADYAGVDSRRMVVTSMTLSGAVGGIGGAVWVLMALGRWVAGVPPFGFDGITVSVLAGNNPLGVLLAAPLFGVLKTGSLSIDFQLGVPVQLVGVIRGLIILFIAMPEFFRMLGARYGYGERANQPAVADGGDS